MDFEKECFVAYCSDDATLRSEFKRLVDLKVQEGKTQLEAVKEIRKASSFSFVLFFGPLMCAFELFLLSTEEMCLIAIRESMLLCE